MRKLSYKPLLFTTTMRNPSRIGAFLKVLLKYEGEILSGVLAEKICGDLIHNGLYRPTRGTASLLAKMRKAPYVLTKAEIKAILKNNPQDHLEGGFPKGWPSRFHTFYSLPMEFGFVLCQMDEPILFSEAGKDLATADHSDIEQSVFLNALVKYQRNNPFRSVLNKNAPFVLLLETIKLLNAKNKKLGNKENGIAVRELPILLYWKDADANQLSDRILRLRQEHRNNPSDETILDICRKEIMAGKDIKRNPNSIMKDYPDDFVRKMRLTGLITLRGGGRFVDINHNENERIRYILKEYSKYPEHKSRESYFKYMSVKDSNLIGIESRKVKSSQKEKMLCKWVEHFDKKQIKNELKALGSKNKLSKDIILRVLPAPVRLEFLAALAVKSALPKVRVIPNYPIDDEGLPTSTAPGVQDTGDIECFEGKRGLLLEVTLLEGATQARNEVWPIDRHLEKFQEKAAESVCCFVAPSIFKDSVKQTRWIKVEYKRTIVAKTIENFVACVYAAERLYGESGSLIKDSEIR